jgi:hypothetical protein
MRATSASWKRTRPPRAPGTPTAPRATRCTVHDRRLRRSACVATPTSQAVRPQKTCRRATKVVRAATSRTPFRCPRRVAPVVTRTKRGSLPPGLPTDTPIAARATRGTGKTRPHRPAPIVTCPRKGTDTRPARPATIRTGTRRGSCRARSATGNRSRRRRPPKRHRTEFAGRAMPPTRLRSPEPPARGVMSARPRSRERFRSRRTRRALRATMATPSRPPGRAVSAATPSPTRLRTPRAV